MSDTRTGSLRIRAHCLCGGGFDGSSTPPAAVEKVYELFWQVHAGEGHGPCDARTARNARRRKDKARSV